MSIVAGDDRVALRRKRRLASFAFVVLLVLAVTWPLPVILLNEATVDAELPLHDKSFLGREAPSWDVVFWAIAGIYALALIQMRSANAGASLRELGDDVRSTVARSLREIGEIRSLRALLILAAGIALVGVVWLFADAWLILMGEGLRTGWPRQIVRHLNRLAGGMNPGMIVGYFAIAGVAFAQPRWWRYAIAMGAGGLGAGIAVQILKLVVSRARPELWFGPFFFTDSTSSSFPSGHTAGAFALAGVLMFASPSIAVRLGAFALAAGVAASRVIVFRHWPSDVVAAALIGLAFAWFFTRAIMGRDQGDHQG